MMDTFEAISLMINFSMLVIVMLKFHDHDQE
ncbi:putative holin-like toxin [Halobacillus sp. A5]|nr:putative holin-like toxin [Halobacillus sp. A5]MCP3028890.1 putative holin-like toxin [Halobacillus sp. A5]